MGEGKISIIDFSRGIAIFTIVLMHTLSFFPFQAFFSNVLSFGGAGVHVFILCSGFGLYLSHQRNNIDYGSFLKRRFFKVYIPYVLVIFLWLVFYNFQRSSIDWSAVASHLFLYKMLNAKLDISICYHYWFISTIIQFYILWPLIVKLMQLRHGLWIAVAISLSWSVVIATLGFENSRPWNSCFLQYLWEFCLGIYLAKYHDIESIIKKVNFGPLLTTAVLSMTITGTLGKMGGAFTLFNDIPSLLAYSSCMLLLYNILSFNISKIKIGGMLRRFFEFTSHISYEWYLLHGLIIVSIQNGLSNLHSPFIKAFISFLLSYVLAMLFSHLLNVINKLSRKDFLQK